MERSYDTMSRQRLRYGDGAVAAPTPSAPATPPSPSTYPSGASLWHAQTIHTTPEQEARQNDTAIFKASVFVLVVLVVLGCSWLLAQAFTLAAIITAVVLALLCAGSLHIAHQWEKAVVLRFGRFNRVAKPGLFATIPLVEYVTMRVDQRTRVTAFGAEETLTADLVPLNVDAVLFWTVWDAKAACFEVGNFTFAVEYAAQTALRDAIGRASVAEVAIRRKQLDKELMGVLEEKVAPWGITILSVEIRDILMPKELQDVMSLEAQAEQRKKARIILMEAEQDISEMMSEMGDTYALHDKALQLRAMHLLYESVRETGGTVVIPSSFAEGFKDLLSGGLEKV
jgi:regulator of protease activity HflC (stomatin/prohibitin superfamily)